MADPAPGLHVVVGVTAVVVVSKALTDKSTTESIGFLIEKITMLARSMLEVDQWNIFLSPCV